jgi:hypothetical protein
VPFRPPFVGSEYGNTNLGYGAYGSANGYRAYGAVRPRYRAGYVRSGYGAYGYSNPGYGAYGAAADTLYNGGSGGAIDFNTGCETSGVMYGQLNDYSACSGD